MAKEFPWRLRARRADAGEATWAGEQDWTRHLTGSAMFAFPGTVAECLCAQEKEGGAGVLNN